MKLITLRRREAIVGALFVSPQLLGFFLFVLGPLIAVLTFGLFRWNIIFGELDFIGLDNFRHMLGDPEVWEVTLTTILFGFGFVPLTVLGGLGLAVALNRRTKVSIALRTAYFMPVVISLAAWTIVWRLLLQPNGPINALLELAGASPIAWLRSPTFALISVISVQVLKTLGYAMVLFLAALQTVPAELVEAARVDGASRAKRFRYVGSSEISGESGIHRMWGRVLHNRVLKLFTSERRTLWRLMVGVCASCWSGWVRLTWWESRSCRMTG